MQTHRVTFMHSSYIPHWQAIEFSFAFPLRHWIVRMVVTSQPRPETGFADLCCASQRHALCSLSMSQAYVALLHLRKALCCRGQDTG